MSEILPFLIVMFIRTMTKMIRMMTMINEDTNVKFYIVVGNNIAHINPSTLSGYKYKSFKQIIKEYGENWKNNDFFGS